VFILVCSFSFRSCVLAQNNNNINISDSSTARPLLSRRRDRERSESCGIIVSPSENKNKTRRKSQTDSTIRRENETLRQDSDDEIQNRLREVRLRIGRRHRQQTTAIITSKYFFGPAGQQPRAQTVKAKITGEAKGKAFETQRERMTRG
jgi:hypothetical protein